MDGRRCRKCLHHDYCGVVSPCAYFVSDSQDDIDEVIELVIEGHRDEYRKAWAEYVDEDSE